MERVIIPRSICIIELLGHCKGSNFNIQIWAWLGYFVCSRREIRFYLCAHFTKILTVSHNQFTNKHTFSDVLTEVLWCKMIQLHVLSNKTTPYFQFLPMSKLDQS